MSKKSPKILRREVEREIRIGLDPKEREPLTQELTTAIKEMDALRIEAADTQAGYRKKIKEIKAKVDEVVVTLDQGRKEVHQVEEIRDFSKGTVKYVRLDTKEIVEKREMTDEDRQLNLGDEASDDRDGDPAEAAN